MERKMKTFSITLQCWPSRPGLRPNAPPAPAPPTDPRVSNSHIHLFTKDPEVQRHFWVDIMGATANKMGPDRDGYTLPKVLVIVDKGTPTAGTEGSNVNHVGFRVKDMKESWTRSRPSTSPFRW